MIEAWLKGQENLSREVIWYSGNKNLKFHCTILLQSYITFRIGANRLKIALAKIISLMKHIYSSSNIIIKWTKQITTVHIRLINSIRWQDKIHQAKDSNMPFAISDRVNFEETISWAFTVVVERSFFSWILHVELTSTRV